MDDDATQHYTPKVKDGESQQLSPVEEMQQRINKDRENERKEVLWKKSPDSLPESQRLLRAFEEFDEICIQNPDKGFVCEFPSLVLSPHEGADLYLSFKEGEDGRRPHIDLCHGSYFNDAKSVIARFYSIEEMYAYDDTQYSFRIKEIAKALEALLDT